MDEKNKSLSFLDLLEQMKTYLGTAKKMGGDIQDRQKSLTEQEEQQEKPEVTLQELASKDEPDPDDGSRER